MTRLFALFLAACTCPAPVSSRDLGYVDTKSDARSAVDGGMVVCAVDISAPGLGWTANTGGDCELAATAFSAFFNSPVGPTLLTIYKDGRPVNVVLNSGTDSASCAGTFVRNSTSPWDWSVNSACVTGSVLF